MTLKKSYCVRERPNRPSAPSLVNRIGLHVSERMEMTNYRTSYQMTGKMAQLVDTGNASPRQPPFNSVQKLDQKHPSFDLVVFPTLWISQMSQNRMTQMTRTNPKNPPPLQPQSLRELPWNRKLTCKPSCKLWTG